MTQKRLKVGQVVTLKNDSKTHKNLKAGTKMKLVYYRSDNTWAITVASSKKSGYYYGFTRKDFVLETSLESTSPSKNPITVDKEFVIQAHKSACPEWKAKIEKKFPALFSKEPKEQKIVGMSGSTIIATVGDESLYIGVGLAPTTNLEDRCLVFGIGSKYKFKVSKYGDVVTIVKRSGK